VKELEAKSKAQGTSLPATLYSPEGEIYSSFEGRS